MKTMSSNGSGLKVNVLLMRNLSDEELIVACDGSADPIIQELSKRLFEALEEIAQLLEEPLEAAADEERGEQQ